MHGEELAQLQQLNHEYCSCVNPAGLWINPYIQQCSSTLTHCLPHSEDETHHIFTPRHPIFDEWDTTKLEDWLCNIKTAFEILKVSCACLTKPKSHDLTHIFVCKALQAGKCWDGIRDILHLKLCNANIHVYTSYYMESNRWTTRHWLSMYIVLEQSPRGVILTVTPPSYIFLSRVSGMHTRSQQRSMKMTPKPYHRSTN